MDPELTSKGKPYAPERFKNIIRERYLISKHCNTSYTDIGEITPTEREILIGFITEEKEKEQEEIEQLKLNSK